MARPCQVQRLRHPQFGAVSGLTAVELDAILQPIDNLHVPQSAVLYDQYGAAPYVYTVRSGMLKLRVDLPNGGQRIVRLVRPGDVAGIETLVGERYHHTAIALRDADICRIPRDVLMKLDQTSPAVHQALMQRWQPSVDQAEQCIVSLYTGPAEARMARLLIMLGCSGNHPETMPSREDMGALLGVTTETASRIMAEFRRRGLVHSDRGADVVCDHAGLNQLAHG